VITDLDSEDHDVSYDSHYSVDVIKATEGTPGIGGRRRAVLDEVTDVDPALKSYENSRAMWLYERSLLTAQRSVRS